jgi:hypothetical protein
MKKPCLMPNSMKLEFQKPSLLDADGGPDRTPIDTLNRRATVLHPRCIPRANRALRVS